MKNDIEKYLIEHCSPTLASLKTGNLMNIPYTCAQELEESVAAVNAEICGRGVEVIILKRCESTALIYTFRRARLIEDLNRKGVRELLAQYGYDAANGVDGCIEHLKSRLKCTCDFPHEIGLFLGYPLGDVIGFIENGGQNSKCTGCWKVYCDECEAAKMFAKFEKCRCIYKKLWLQGRNIVKLTVAA